MFDNPKKDLQWLDDALRSLDEPEEADFSWEQEEDIFDDFGPGKNNAVDLGRTVYADEEEDIFAAEPLTRKERKLLKKQARLQAKLDRKQQKKKRRQLFRLTLLAAAEIAAILFIIRWWLLWLT